MVSTSHDSGSTFDRVNRRHLSEAAAVVAILTRELANNVSIPLPDEAQKHIAVDD